jgi:hypothetical protein
MNIGELSWPDPAGAAMLKPHRVCNSRRHRPSEAHEGGSYASN